MGNVRVFQLARDLNLSSQEVIDRLKKLGADAKTASSSVDEDTADKLKRAIKIDSLTARKKRIYGSEEDEAEREQEEAAHAARVAAERAAREQAAAEAKAAAEARKAGRLRPRGALAEAEARNKAAVAVDEPPPALQHAPGAPRLAPKLAHPPVPALAEADLGEAEAPSAEEDQIVAPPKLRPLWSCRLRQLFPRHPRRCPRRPSSPPGSRGR